MNQILKAMIATLGAINVIFSIFLPIALALVITKMYNITGVPLYVLIIAGSLSGLYRAVDVAGIDTMQYIIEKYISKNSKSKTE